MTEIKEGLKGVVIAQSKISFIDGSKGELIYSGINIHELAEQAKFEEVIFLLMHQRLPSQGELQELKLFLRKNAHLPETVIEILRRLPEEMEPMASLRTAVSALSAFDPDIDSTEIETQSQRILKLCAQIPSLVAAIERIRQGKDLIAPDEELGIAANFLYMLRGERPDEIAIRAMDVALILHADHGFNASTFAARVTTSTLSDVYSAVTSAIGTLKGPLHGGANQQVMEMLLKIGDQDPVEFVKNILANKGKVMGFGHRVYRTEDPRATHLRRMSQQLCESTGNQKFFEMSQKIEQYMNDEKKINANVDFYSATVYHSLGIPSDLYTLLFAMSRISGWGAHILEQYKNNSLIRPRAEYVGPRDQHYIPIAER